MQKLNWWGIAVEGILLGLVLLIVTQAAKEKDWTDQVGELLLALFTLFLAVAGGAVLVFNGGV